MREWLYSIFDTTLLTEAAESRFECSWCHLTFENRPTACPDCRGLVVRVVAQ